MINPPNIPCKIDINCTLNPSEDKSKLEHMFSNIFPGHIPKTSNRSLYSTIKDIYALEKIYETIHSRKTQRAYRRQLKKNLLNDSTWFYLNKQAAFMNVIALCENADESPLGPIKIILTSNSIEDLIGWLVSEQ